ncbi:autoinducer binding domain-containing protein [Rhizobium leguminosarum bv. viciae 248]|uniref:helix-turn-helix transcriptional regulator n=1 Tax=Rhizobium leguminosarum TaxID=384 RepID=UPI0003751F2D|nr:autoinducer binding domain-containing protein [Rhizobium leguminosarum]MCA2407886.1 autoinducer binding domain-containing protein [Rhizobium leguminosarum]NKM65783.1 LuxR family transcriptional regulator [Rhizobium leguminosarum bv. viciae]QHW24607.1 autoinducer binding domain-containing protein [Rhizobium leguminosarum bv. viciae 248]
MPADQHILQEALDCVRNLHEIGHLSAIVHQLRTLVGAANLAYQALFIPGRVADDRLIAATYSDKWKKLYLSKNYFRTDPIEIAARKTSQPLDWNLLRSASKETASFFAEAECHGVGNNGVSIPLVDAQAGRALFSVTSNLEGNDWAAFKARALPSLIQIGQAIQLRTAEIEVKPAARKFSALTAKETDYLALYVGGYEIKQIGDMRSVSGTAVRAALNSATEKLDARGPRHAGYLAIALGIIPTSMIMK